MKTKYLVIVSAEFDTSDKRDAAYDKLKSYMTGNKATDGMTSITITKTEQSKPEASSETL